MADTSDWKTGDWSCSRCRNHNFAVRDFCRHCFCGRGGYLWGARIHWDLVEWKFELAELVRTVQSQSRAAHERWEKLCGHFRDQKDPMAFHPRVLAQYFGGLSYEVPPNPSPAHGLAGWS